MPRRPSPAEPLPDHCLNCGAAIAGRFCVRCGQENEDPRPRFGTALRDLWDEFVQIDGRVLRTLAALLFQPGRLTNQYLAGQRIRNISPFRLYFFATALFVLFTYRTFYIEDEAFSRLAPKIQKARAKAIEQDVAPREKEKPPGPKGPATRPAASMLRLPETLLFFGTPIDVKRLPESVQAYRTAQERIEDPAKRDPAWVQVTKTKLIYLKRNPYDFFRSLVYGAAPNVLLFAVPLMALMMKCFYPRRLYFEHLIFALHTHTLTLVAIGLALALYHFGGPRVQESADGIAQGTILLLLLHHFVAARRVYAQGRLVTALKGALLTGGYGCIFGFAATLGLLVTLLSAFLNL